jgi:hypothetical protein
VLEAAVSLQEQSYMVTVTDIAMRTGLEVSVVARALEALDPVYVDFRKTTTGGDQRFWYVYKVTAEARRAVGQWPTAKSLVSKLAEQLAIAAKDETDADRQSLLIYAARLIGDTLREDAERAASQVLAPAFSDVDWPEEEPLPVMPLLDEEPVLHLPPQDDLPQEEPQHDLPPQQEKEPPLSPAVEATDSAASVAEASANHDAPLAEAIPEHTEADAAHSDPPLHGGVPQPVAQKGASQDVLSVLERTARGLRRLPDTLPAPETTAPDLMPLPDPTPFPNDGPEAHNGSAGDNSTDTDHDLAQAPTDGTRN